MRQPTPKSRATLRVLAVLLGSALVVVPSLGASADSSDPAATQRTVRAKRAQVASRLNVLKASDAQIQRALDALERNVAAQQARVASARQAAATAEKAAADAQAAENAKRAELGDLQGRLRQIAIDSYINPSTGDLAATLNAKSFADVARKRELLQYRVNRGSDLVDRLKAASEDLAVTRQAAEQARDRAHQRKAAVESQLASYKSSLSQQQAFATQIEARIDEAQAESDSLSRRESQLAAEIARRKAIVAATSRSSRGAVPGASRSVRGVSITSVRGIEVATSIADNLASLLNAADGDGISLSGSGYRDPSDQVALRRAHCGSSDYAVYEMPPSQCSPPTARPGSSMHEQGLAIDFTWQGRIIGSRSSPAYQWLARNASRFGFYNLPSEPWHWSTNGN